MYLISCASEVAGQASRRTESVRRMNVSNSYHSRSKPCSRLYYSPSGFCASPLFQISLLISRQIGKVAASTDFGAYRVYHFMGL